MITVRFSFIFLIALALMSCTSAINSKMHTTEFSDCKGCPLMMPIPIGTFKMGDLIGDGRDDEMPVQVISIKAPIAMSKFPVTVGAFRAFVFATGYVTEAEMNSDEGLETIFLLDGCQPKIGNLTV